MNSKNRINWLIVMVVAAIILTLTACGGSSSDLIYRVAGTATEAKVTYTDAGGNLQEETVTLPWETRVEINEDFEFELTAGNDQPSGKIECQVLLDNRKLGDGNGEAYVVCSGSVHPGNDNPGSFSSHSGESYLEDAQGLMDNGELAEALAKIQEILDLAPNYSEAYVYQGLIYEMMEEPDLAMEAYGKAIDLDPNSFDAYNNRGWVNKTLLGQYEQAIVEYNKAIELRPDYVNAYLNRAFCYANLGEYEKALADGNKAIELEPDNAYAYLDRAFTYESLGQYEKALADYNKAIELEPDNVDAYLYRGFTYESLAEHEQALADYNKVIELEPDNVDAYDYRASIYTSLGEYEQALADYSQATELNPDDARFWNNLCWHGSLLGRAAEFIDACEQSVALDPEHGGHRDSRGLAYALTGDYESAIEDFKFYVDWSKENDQYEQDGTKRESWIAELEAGRNPFDEATLQELLLE